MGKLKNIGADAEGESQDRHGGEAGVFLQRAERVDDVPEHI